MTKKEALKKDSKVTDTSKDTIKDHWKKQDITQIPDH